MIRRALLAALLAATTLPARAAPNGWPEQLAASLSDAKALTSQTIATALLPAIHLDSNACATARLPDSLSAAPVTDAMVSYVDDKACTRPTPLALLSFSITAAPAMIARLRTSLATHLAAPCFDGALPSDPRRHAPLRHLLAWKLPGRVLTLGEEAGAPETVAIALLQDVPATQGAALQLRQSFLDSLPAACR